MLGFLLMTLAALGGSIHVGIDGVTELNAQNAQHAKLSYDAVEQRGRRKSPSIDSRSEDLILDSAKRHKLQATALDIGRNFSIAKWMVRRHLDYVASFDFHARFGDEATDIQAERLMYRWFAKENCDRAGRHPFWRIVRLLELMRTVAGDVGTMKLADARLQCIEGDRVRNPTGTTTDGEHAKWVHGVKLDAGGAATHYAISKRRTYGGFEHERIVPASNFILHGHFDRFDQVRGISPVASALNPLRDVYENFDYALAKAKVTQLFALAITSKRLTDTGGEDNVTVTETEDTETGLTRNKYEVDFGKGPVKLELDEGDEAKFLESATPSTQFQDFTQLVIQVALKALDIPFSFYDESHTNFFGSRAAWLHYERSCIFKRRDLLDVLNDITKWRLMLFVLDGELKLPRGVSLDEHPWEWVPLGMPWWDPSKEINGDLAAIRAGLDNPQRITKDRGKGDWYDNVDEIAKATAYARERGVQLAFDPLIQPVQVVDAEEVQSGK
jgi:capsid protein